MKHTGKSHTYSARKTHTYPGGAEPGYFAQKLLDAVTAAATVMGGITVLFFLLTM